MPIWSVPLLKMVPARIFSSPRCQASPVIVMVSGVNYVCFCSFNSKSGWRIRYGEFLKLLYLWLKLDNKQSRFPVSVPTGCQIKENGGSEGENPCLSPFSSCMSAWKLGGKCQWLQERNNFTLFSVRQVCISVPAGLRFPTVDTNGLI